MTAENNQSFGQRGGRRAGSGRKKGAATKITRAIADKLAAEGGTPLEYMLQVMRDEKADAKRRDEMAKSAAPYIHPRLATVEHQGKGGGPLQIQIVRFGDADHPAK